MAGDLCTKCAESFSQDECGFPGQWLQWVVHSQSLIKPKSWFGRPLWDLSHIRICSAAPFLAWKLIGSDSNMRLCNNASENLSWDMANCSNLGRRPAVLQQEGFVTALWSLLLTHLTGGCPPGSAAGGGVDSCLLNEDRGICYRVFIARRY